MPERSWLTETEYTLDENLHTLEHQTIVLDLENSAGDRAVAGAGVRSNHHRLLVEEDHRFSFCIPVDVPHILRIKVKQQRGPTLINNRRGGRCEAVLLPAGRYELRIDHDSRSVPAGAQGLPA